MYDSADSLKHRYNIKQRNQYGSAIRQKYYIKTFDTRARGEMRSICIDKIKVVQLT